MAPTRSPQHTAGSNAVHVFVGRQEEQARLATALGAPGCSVVVVGEAGVGKTSLIRQVVREAGISGYEGGALSTLRWVPYLALQQAIRPSRPADRALFAGDSEFVAAAIERIVGSGVLVIDDVHWADSGTWSVLRLLAGHLRMITAVRLGDPAAAEALRRLADEDFERLDLAPLPQEDALAVVRQVRADLPDYAARSLVARAGGNPLILEELAAGNVDSLKLAIAGRLAALPQAAVAELEMLALAGHGLPASVFAELEALRRAGMITEGQDYGGRDVHVRHALLAEVIVAGIEPGRLSAVHRRLAEVVPDAGSRARHLLLAGEPENAYAEAMVAVDAAATPGERVAHLATAASCVPPEEAPALLVRAARAAGEAGEVAAAWDLLDRIPDPGLDAVLVRAHLFSETGDSEGWLAELGRARTALDSQPGPDHGASSAVDATGRVTLLAEEARAVLLASGDPPRAIEQARVAVAEADRLGLRQGLAHYVLGTALYYVADRGSHAELEIARGHARREGDLSVEMRAANNLIVVHEGSGDPAVGRAVAEEMMEYAAGLKLLRWRRHFAASALNLAMFAGDVDEVARRAPELLTGQMMKRTRDQLTSTYALALMHLGRIDESLRIAGAQLADSEIFRSNLICLHAIAASYRGDDDAVLGFWEPFVQAAENMHRIALAVPIFARAALDRAPGSALDAGLLPGLPDLAEAYELPMLRGAPVELDALAARGSDPTRAASLFAQAAGLWQPYSRESEIRCRWLQGVALAAAGRGDETVMVLADAEEHAQRHRMAPLAALIQRSLRELGVRRPASRGSGPLTVRQTEILDLVGRGLTDAEIAGRLGLSVRTVHSHLAAARKTLGAANRHQAALLAAELTHP